MKIINIAHATRMEILQMIFNHHHFYEVNIKETRDRQEETSPYLGRETVTLLQTSCCVRIINPRSLEPPTTDGERCHLDMGATRTAATRSTRIKNI